MNEKGEEVVVVKMVEEIEEVLEEDEEVVVVEEEELVDCLRAGCPLIFNYSGSQRAASH